MTQAQTTQEQTGVDNRGKPLQCLKHGKVSELTMFYRVKPGHEKAIREAAQAFCLDTTRASAANIAQIGIHELRIVTFDNDTRMQWMTSFDTDWDPYIDDTIDLLTTQLYGTVFQHTVEAPEGMAERALPNAYSAVKDLFNANRVNAAGFLTAFPNLTFRQQQKDERLRKAFEQVLDNPEGAKALQHPALKPLLEEAAD